MTVNFDELLKKGKQSVVSGNAKEDKWKERIGAILHLVHDLNEMYGNDQHNLRLEPKKCSGCNKATFVLAVKTLETPHKSLRFHKSKWKFEDSKYMCDSCRKA